MAALLAVLLLMPPSVGCSHRPVAGPIVSPFAPGDGYSGHWGVDFRVAPGTPVVAVLPGTVSFAGLVVDNLAVTIEHGGGVRTSYSYLEVAVVLVGDRVGGGDVIGRSGWDHGQAGLHLSLRVGDRYLDPVMVLECAGPPGWALRLVSPPTHPRPYAVRRAARHPGRNLRSTSRGPSHGRGGGAADARPRCGYLHHRR